MNSLDKIVRREKRIRYKRLKKLFKARDMASEYLNINITVSKLDKYFKSDEHQYHSTGRLAKIIIDDHKKILGITKRPPKPVSQIK